VSRSQLTASPQRTRHSPVDDVGELNIIVLGQTGAGKSSFINQFLPPDHRAGAPRTAEIGHSLLSCTKGVNEYSCIADNGRRLTLIDTPGFDDTYSSDAEVLTSIANYLTRHFQSGRYIHGVIFLHRIIDVRLSASAIKMAEIVKRICGREFYARVALVTNMWQLLTNRETGYQRERELLNHVKFWADFRNASAPHFQHSKTKESASKIMEGFIRHLKSAPTRLSPLKIQIEIVQDGRPISETDAGDFLEGELVGMKIKHQRALQQIKHDIQIATQESDSDTAELLSESYGSTKIQLQQADRDIQILRRKDGDFIRSSITRSWTDPSNLASRQNLQLATPPSTDSESESERHRYVSDAKSMPTPQPPQFVHFQEHESPIWQQRTQDKAVNPIPIRSLSPKKAPGRKAERDVSLGVESSGGKPRSTKSSSRSSGKNSEALLVVSAWMHRSTPTPQRMPMTAHGALRQDGVRSRSAHAWLPP
jgi:GTP-binding protein EngB required for normal cell division